MVKKFPKGGIRKNIQQFADADYLHKLSPAERAWYDKFIQGEYGANHKAAEMVKGEPLTKKEKKRINAQNNRRVRDVFNGHIDRGVSADRAIAKTEKADDTQDQTSEEHD